MAVNPNAGRSLVDLLLAADDDEAQSAISDWLAAGNTLADLVSAGSSVPGLYGDGSDGDVTLSAATTTLTRDMLYENLTIPVGKTLRPDGWAVVVKDTLTNEGLIETLPTAGNGNGSKQGDTGQPGGVTDGTAGSPAGRIGGGSGAGGDGSGGVGGAAGNGGPGTFSSFVDPRTFIGAGFESYTGGSRGGSGAGDGTSNAGGRSGNGGHIMSVWAKHLINNGIIRAAGQDGSAGSAVDTGGGGGGGGGAALVICDDLTGSGTTEFPGGAGGASGGGAGTAGDDGDDGYLYLLTL